MNNSHDAIVINQTNFKKISKKIKKNLEELNLQIPLTAVNEVFAKSLGYRNYDALHSAFLEEIAPANKNSVNIQVTLGNNHLLNKLVPVSEQQSITQPVLETVSSDSEIQELYKSFLILLKQHCTLNILSRRMNDTFSQEQAVTHMLQKDMGEYLMLDDFFIDTVDSLFSFINKYIIEHNISFKEFFEAPYIYALGIALYEYKNNTNYYFDIPRIYFDKEKKNLIFSIEQIEEFLAISNIKVFFNFIQFSLCTAFPHLNETLFSNEFLNRFVSNYYGIMCSKTQKIIPFKLESIKNHIYYSASFFAAKEKEATLKNNEISRGFSPKIRQGIGGVAVSHYSDSQESQIYTLFNENGYSSTSFSKQKNFFLLVCEHDKQMGTRLSYQLFNDVMKFNSLLSINNTLLNMIN